MARFIFRSRDKEQYDVRELVDTASSPFDREALPYAECIICDIDKTYLETEFESLLGMAKIAFENAREKVTVRGAAEVLKHLKWDEFRIGREAFAMHFISSSPPQLRKVVEEKMLLDGLDWVTTTFKNQAYNLKLGKYSLLRQHVAYKSLAIVASLQGARKGSPVHFIGDFAEADSYVYLGVWLLCSRQISLQGYEKWLLGAGVAASDADVIVQFAAKLPDLEAGLIMIRNLLSYRKSFLPPLTAPIVVFDNYLELAFLYYATGRLSAKNFREVVRIFHNKYLFSLVQISGLLAYWQVYLLGSGLKVEVPWERVAEDLDLPMPKLSEVSGPEYHRLQELRDLPEKTILALGQRWYKDLVSIRRLT